MEGGRRVKNEIKIFTKERMFVISFFVFAAVASLPVFSFLASLLPTAVIRRRSHITRAAIASLIGTVTTFHFFLFFDAFLNVVGHLIEKQM